MKFSEWMIQQTESVTLNFTMKQKKEMKFDKNSYRKTEPFSEWGQF